MSSYLPNREQYAPNAASLVTPSYSFHGKRDPVVGLPFGQAAVARLVSLDKAASVGVTHDLKVYPRLEHSSEPGELKDVLQFLEKCLPPL